MTNDIHITADELHDAYRFAQLRRIGIGYVTAITAPDILAALRGTALMMKRKKQQHGTPAPEGLKS
ncbi:MAG: hypothetical protein A2143_08110 [Gallionellales bacterium RBG_16_57_15]|nr:MAG: hypothetical protein A2143_08110 [Gallionellales bacterium RBG_16_57_15]